jgi:cellobiose phosphorylase
MTYGFFNDQSKEYIITTPYTPTKWINYIGNLSFGGFVDQLGGSIICKGDPALNRITKYMPQLPDSSFNGESAYIKVTSKDESFIFSPYINPTHHKYDTYECKVGLGYNIYKSSYKDIHTEITAFVPIDSEVEIRKITITSDRLDIQTIEVIPVVEYTHFDALKQFTNADWVPQTMMSDLDDSHGTVLKQYAFMKKETDVNYFTSNCIVDSFETDRRRFLKDNEGGSWQLPKALLEDKLSNYETRRGDNIAALRHKFEFKSKITVITQLGQTTDFESTKVQISKYRDESEVDKAFIELKEFWLDYLSTLKVSTPNESLNSMINIHNPKQCYMTKNWSRYLSLYQLGLGGRGIGIRDSSQDTMGVISNMPNEAKELIKTLLTMQRRDGSAYHQYNPKTLMASIGDAHEDEEAPDYYGDDHLWLILASVEFIKETGDTDFLKLELPFYDKDKNDIAIETATVEEHIKRALHFTKHDLGQNNLPHLGFADWNDPVNLPTGSESLFNANLYGYGLKLFISLLEYQNRDASVYISDYEQMKKTFHDVAWDGNWFIRYIDQNNVSLGSKSNEVGQIFSNAQSWSVISGYASQMQAKTALTAVYESLNTKNGIKLSYPGFNGYDKEKGGISSYPPGAKENGGIFLHANPWVMYAETLIGNGDRAFEYYNQINPIAKNNVIDTYESAPYVYPQNILGDEHPQFGLARNCWLSGTASWCYQVATKEILGVKPDFKGLQINPCIPKDWIGFEVTRLFRGSTYKINIENPEGISKGVKEVYVDGQLFKNKHLPLGNNTYDVKVIMGV